MAEETIGVGEGRSHSLRGRTLGPYQIEAQIGRGGMAVVYRAIHLPLERVVALKVLLPSLSGDKEFVDRFLAEARAAARLDYPHIVPIYDSGEINGNYYIAMKLLDGRDLRTLLVESRAGGTGRLPLERAIGIASQVAGALEYAHQHHLVHRDVKPANIIVDDDDRAMLTDFGIARALDRAQSTMTGIVIGTPTYMSPEQALARPVDSRSDLYSLGVVVYEMLSGSPPFSGNPQTIMFSHVNTPAPPLDRFNADVPAGVAEVVLRALAKNPAERYQRAGALALALSNAAGGQLAEKARATAEGESAASLSAEASFEDPGGRISGLHTPVPGGITHGTLAPPTAKPQAATWRLAVPIGIATAVVLCVAALLWLFLAGPLAGGDGRLSVTTDPPGAAVSVDGSVLGVTPLASTRLPPGTHSLIVAKGTYAPVQRTEKIESRASDHLSFVLAPLPAASLLSVTSAIVATDIGQDATGAITFGSIVTSVTAGQEFGLIVTVAQTQPGVRDITANYEIALFDASGNQLRTSPPGTLTVKKDDRQGRSVAFKFTFQPQAAIGSYQLKFFIDNKEVVSKPVALVQ